MSIHLFYLVSIWLIFYIFLSHFYLNKAIAGQFKQHLVYLPTTSHINDINLNKLDQSKYDINNLRNMLSLTFPYQSDKPIPRLVWQTWKVNAKSEAFPDDYKEAQQ